MEVELTSRPGMIDISIKDMETQSVTDISIIEIFHCLLPSDRGRATFTAVLKGMETGGKIEMLLIFITV